MSHIFMLLCASKVLDCIHTYSYKHIRESSSDFIKTKFLSLYLTPLIYRKSNYLTFKIKLSQFTKKKKQKMKDCFLYFMITYNHKHIWILKSEYAQSKVSGRLQSKLLIGSTSQGHKVDYMSIISQKSWGEKEYKVEPKCFNYACLKD